MDRITLAAVIGMGLVFVTGVLVGVVLMVAMAIRDRRRSDTQEPPDIAAFAVPRLDRSSRAPAADEAAANHAGFRS